MKPDHHQLSSKRRQEADERMEGWAHCSPPRTPFWPAPNRISMNVQLQQNPWLSLQARGTGEAAEAGDCCWCSLRAARR